VQASNLTYLNLTDQLQAKAVLPPREERPDRCPLGGRLGAPSVSLPLLTRVLSVSVSGLLSQLLLSFSAVRNSRKILKCDTPQDSLTSIHGLRFLSLAWVVLVHTYLQVFAIAGTYILTFPRHTTHLLRSSGLRHRLPQRFGVHTVSIFK
jgi:hypothetical protein